MRISDKQRGFTLIELLVVITIIGILAAMALPNFIKMKAKAKEAEVKAGIHAIQVALERYAVDSGGNYPLGLVGADYGSNIYGRSEHYDYGGQRVFNMGLYGMARFRQVQFERIWEGNMDGPRWMCDPLVQYGYLGQFPPNPFQRRNNGMWSGQQDYEPSSVNYQPGGWGDFNFQIGAYGVGGRHGTLMWDVSHGLGSVPNVDLVGQNIDTNDEGGEIEHVDNDVEGNFYYHPKFTDGRTVAEHKFPNIQDTGATLNGRLDLGCPRLYTHDANGYVLYGLGSAFNEGRDYFTGYDFSYNPDQKRGGGGQKGYWCMSYGGTNYGSRSCQNGYSSAEYDPLVGDGDPRKHKDEWARARDTGGTSGPDGIPDFFIIDVSSSVDVTGDYSPNALNDLENANNPNP